MLKILLESAIIETLENGDSIKELVDYTYGNINRSFTTDLEKEVRDSEMSKEEFEEYVNKVLYNENFKSELKELGLMEV